MDEDNAEEAGRAYDDEVVLDLLKNSVIGLERVGDATAVGLARFVAGDGGGFDGIGVERYCDRTCEMMVASLESSSMTIGSLNPEVWRTGGVLGTSGVGEGKKV